MCGLVVDAALGDRAHDLHEDDLNGAAVVEDREVDERGITVDVLGDVCVPVTLVFAFEGRRFADFTVGFDVRASGGIVRHEFLP